MERERERKRHGEREDDGWIPVARRQQKGRILPRRQTPREGMRGVTFFVRNFPEECTTKELWWIFCEAGKVLDLFIPEKRDRRGNRFGFVRFDDKSDANKVLDKLNSLWIGSYIIRASLPRFVRNQGKTERAREGNEGPKDMKKVEAGASRPGVISYSEVLMGTKKERVPREENDREKWEVNPMQFQSSEAEGKWLNGAFTGHIKGDFSWNEHGEEMQTECAGSLKLTNMGSNMILIQSISKTETSEVVKIYDEWTSFWLDWCRPWTYTDANQQRVVWTRWVGVPLQAWSLRFFCLGCAKFGNLMEMHEDTKLKKRLDEALIRISTGMKTVDQIMECKIDGAWFKIRIEEVRCMERETLLKPVVDDDSDSDVNGLDVDDEDKDESVEATIKSLQDLYSGGLATGDIGDDASVSQMGGEKACALENSISKKMTAGINGRNNNYEVEGSNRGLDLVGPQIEEREEEGSAETSRVPQIFGSNFSSLVSSPKGGSPTGKTNGNGAQMDSQLNEESRRSGSQALGDSSPMVMGPENSVGWEGSGIETSQVSMTKEENAIREEAGSKVLSIETHKVENKRGKRKTKHIMDERKSWGEFIRPMASEEEGRLMGNRTSGNEELSRGLRAKPTVQTIEEEGWNFGKKLGLSSKEIDDRAGEKMVGGKGEGQERRQKDRTTK